jgi:hypothetical protein
MYVPEAEGPQQVPSVEEAIIRNGNTSPVAPTRHQRSATPHGRRDRGLSNGPRHAASHVTWISGRRVEHHHCAEPQPRIAQTGRLSTASAYCIATSRALGSPIVTRRPSDTGSAITRTGTSSVSSSRLRLHDASFPGRPGRFGASPGRDVIDGGYWGSRS